MEADQLLRGLDAQQRIAVLSDAAPLAIVAAAGSGKTTVLTRRIARRIADGSADPAHVLALTFTREASSELRRRLRRLGVPARIETGTFHAVALRLLSDRAASGDRPPPVIAPDRQRLMREVLTETRRRVEPTAALADIDWARARLVDPLRFGEATRRARRRPALDPSGFAEVSTRFQALKRRRGVVDFDDLLVELLESMRRDPLFADVVRWRFRHLFVDEAQDMNPLQFEVLTQVRGDRSDICLVGDPRQAIYGWNGADPTLLARVEEHLPRVTVVSLTGNHRCTPQIVGVGAAALRAAAIDDDTSSRRGDGPAVAFVACGDDRDEAAVVAQRVRALVGRRGAAHVAVLARTNEQLTEIGRALAAVRVPSEVATGRNAGAGPVQRTVLEAARCASREQLAAWAETVWSEGTEDEVRRRVAEEVDRFLASGVPGGFRSWVDARHPFDDLEAAADAAAADGSVTLATFHAAKGREWEAVVVTGVEAGLVPHGASASDEQIAEEARLLYVALTRASDELVVTSASARRGAAVAESPWLPALRAADAGSPSPVAPPLALRSARTAPDPLDGLRRWRAGVARAAGIAERAVCSDSTLRTLLADPPEDADDIAARLGLNRSAAERLAPKLLDLLVQSS